MPCKPRRVRDLPHRHEACNARCMKEYAANIRSPELSRVDVPAASGDAAAVAGAASSADTESVCASAAASADPFLAKAAKEPAKGHVDASLWTRALAEAGGDKALATRIYLDSHATAPRIAKRHDKAARRSPAAGEGHSGCRCPRRDTHLAPHQDRSSRGDGGFGSAAV